MAIALFIPTSGMSSMSAGFMGVGDLNDYAERNFSSFEGDESPFEGYTGEYDDFLDFGGPNRSFATEINDPRIFVMTILNDNSTNESVYLIPGNLWQPFMIKDINSTAVTTAAGSPLAYTTTVTNSFVNANGYLNDGASASIDGNPLTGSGNPKTIKEFYAFIKASPCSCNLIKIQSNNNATQMDMQLTQRSASPFRTLEDKIWTPGAYQDQDTYRDKIIKFPTSGLILSDQTQLEYPIMGKSTITVTFFCGAVLNHSKALEEKRTKAVSTFHRVGLQNVRQYHAIKGTPVNQARLVK